jgi:polysaccharide biosynthesis/export protein
MKACLRALLVGTGVSFLLVFSTATARAQTDHSNDNTLFPKQLEDPETANEDDPSTSGGAAASAAAAALVAGGGVIGPDYTVGPEDLLTIEVFNVPEMKQTVRVENDGSIRVKLLGRVQAAGYTTAQLREHLAADWGKNMLESPEVSVFVKEFHGRPVTVLGGVEKPGVYQIPGSRNLMEVLAMAGGLGKKPAAGRTLLVTRKSGFGVLDPVPGLRQVDSDQIEIDIPLLLYSHEEALNLFVKPFDLISVTKAGVVYVTGEVKKPGGFVLEDKESISVLQALALAEGTTTYAAKRSVRIIHRTQDGTLSETPLDVGKILNGKNRDVMLAANDILFVPNSHSKYVGKKTAESIIGTITGLIIFRGL